MEIIHTMSDCAFYAPDTIPLHIALMPAICPVSSKKSNAGHCQNALNYGNIYTPYKSLQNIISHRMIDSGETVHFWRPAPTGHAKTLRQNGPGHDDTL